MLQCDEAGGLPPGAFSISRAYWTMRSNATAEPRSILLPIAESRLAHATWSGQGEQPHLRIKQPLLDAHELPRPTEQRRRLAGHRGGLGHCHARRRPDRDLASGAPGGPHRLLCGVVQAQGAAHGLERVAVRPGPAALEIADRVGADGRLDQRRQLFLAQGALVAMMAQ